MKHESTTAAPLADALFARNPVPTWIYDPRTLRFLAVNDAAIAAYGYSRDEFLAMTLHDIRPPEEHARMEAHAARRSDGNGETDVMQSGGWRHIRRDGSMIDVEIASIRDVDHEGTKATLVLAFDVTEQNRRIERLRAHEAALEAAEELGQQGSFMLDLRDDMLTLRGISIDAFGRPEISAQGFLDELRRISDPANADELQRFITAFQRREPYEGELRVVIDGASRWFFTRTAPVLSADGAVTALIGVAGDVTARKAEGERLRALAFTDEATGLPNRTALLQGEGRGRNAVVGLLLVRFVWIAAASQRSQHTGVRNAQAIAAVLRRLAPPDAALYRYSDDTFALAICGTRRMRPPAPLAKRILTALQHPVAVGTDEVVVTPSIGIAVADVLRRDVADLVRRAESALDEAGRSPTGIMTYSHELERAHDRRATIERHLRHAIAEHRVGVVYQPIISLATEKIVGAEALMRWDCPGIGPVAPDEFIALAEESGVILALGEWILREASAQARRWEIEQLAPIRMAVNVSARQVQQREFVRLISNVCETTGLAPQRLELELTERVMLHRDGLAMRNLEALRRMGVSISVDDFGTGYSALSYLNTLPLDTVKLDRAFVAPIAHDPFQADIARMVVDLAHRRGLTVTGEAVETDGQATLLRQIGCDDAQGFLFGSPMPAAAFAAALREVNG